MSGILVVDDKAVFREPIAAALRHEGYETRCAQNGMEALALVQQNRPDLILLDIAMPLMDGLNCLRRLRADPKTRTVSVIMLTALSERSLVLNAAKIGIQGYLLKSQFSLDTLLARVKKVLESESEPPVSSAPDRTEDRKKQDANPQEAGTKRGANPQEVSTKRETSPQEAPPPALNRSQVLARLQQAFELRPIPPVLQHVLALTNSSASSIDDIAAAVHQDQSLAVRILRIANSAFMGSGKAVTSLMDAARRLGTSGVRDAAVALLAIEHFADPEADWRSMEFFWEHSLACATLAQLIGESLRTEKDEPLFLAGLLHDIGRLVLRAAFPQHYQWALRLAAERNVDLSIPEREVFGLTHTDVTDDLLGRWKIPPAVREAVVAHTLGAEQIKRTARNCRSPLIVALANRLAHLLVLGESGSSMLCPIGGFLAALNLRPERMLPVIQETIRRTEQAKLFYASQCRDGFAETLPKDITRTAGGGVKVAVLNVGATIAPLELFFRQLGWLDSDAPVLAVADVADEEELGRCLSELKKLEDGVGTTLPLLVASPKASVRLSPEQAQTRPWATVPLPGRYQCVVKAVIDLSATNVQATGSGADQLCLAQSSACSGSSERSGESENG